MDDEGIWPDWLLNRDYWQQVCWMAPILLPDHPVTMDDMLSAHHLSQLQQQWKVPSTSPPPHLSSFKRVCCGPLQTQTIDGHQRLLSLAWLVKPSKAPSYVGACYACGPEGRDLSDKAAIHPGRPVL